MFRLIIEQKFDIIIIMQLKRSNVKIQYNNAPFNNQIQHHPIKYPINQPIFTYFNTAQTPKTIYSQSNPYLLNMSPHPQKIYPVVSTRDTNHSRQLSESSTRSLNTRRTNGLKIVQKPKINRGSHSNIQLGHEIEERSYKRQNIQRQLQIQNRRLREQNNFLKQKLRKFQQNSKKQIVRVQERINSLIIKAMDLQSQIKQNDNHQNTNFDQKK